MSQSEPRQKGVYAPRRDTRARPPGKRPWRFRRWLIALPFTLLVLLALAWSAAWFVLAGRLEGEVDAWLARQAEAGRVYACAERAVGGFPFRLEVACNGPSLTFGQGEGALTLSARRFVALAQIYNWRHAIGELEGPGRIAPAGESAAVLADWSTARASYRVDEAGAMRQTDLVFQNLVLDLASAGATEPAPDGPTVAEAQFHLRPDPDAAESERRFDLALVLEEISGIGEETASASLAAKAEAVPGGLGEPADFLRRWQAQGGALDLRALEVDWSDFQMRGRGRLALNAEGYPTGTLETDLAGLDSLSAAMPQQFAPGDLGQYMDRALGLVGEPSQIGERDASRLEFAFAGGQIRIGPFALVDLPSLF